MKNWTTYYANYPNTGLLPWRKEQLSRSRFNFGSNLSEHRTRKNPILTAYAEQEFASGRLPDLEAVCQDLIRTFRVRNYPFNATQFIDVLENFSLGQKDLQRIMEHPERKHVLVQNGLLKLVLIRWESSDLAPVHGHPSGGCAFKVLSGQIEEQRFLPSDPEVKLSETVMQAGAMSYIDDHMAFHAVGNPFAETAISLHAYIPDNQ